MTCLPPTARSRSRRSTSEASTSSRPRTLTRPSVGRRRSRAPSGNRSKFVRSSRRVTMPGADNFGEGVPSGPDEAAVGRIFREDSGRSVATLIRVFGDIDVAEDAVQEAFAIALRKWPRDGLPPNPGGWITTTATNRAIDWLRRDARGRDLFSEAAVLSPGNDHSAMNEE